MISIEFTTGREGREDCWQGKAGAIKRQGEEECRVVWIVCQGIRGHSSCHQWPFHTIICTASASVFVLALTHLTTHARVTWPQSLLLSIMPPHYPKFLSLRLTVTFQRLVVLRVPMALSYHQGYCRTFEYRQSLHTLCLCQVQQRKLSLFFSQQQSEWSVMIIPINASLQPQTAWSLWVWLTPFSSSTVFSKPTSPFCLASLGCGLMMFPLHQTDDTELTSCPSHAYGGGNGLVPCEFMDLPHRLWGFSNWPLT